MKYPTAQALPDLMATPNNALACVPTLGLGTAVQICPLKCSARVWVILRLLSGANCPTAQTSLAELAATPARELSEAPTFGLGTVSQSSLAMLLPANASTRIRTATSDVMLRFFMIASP